MGRKLALVAVTIALALAAAIAVAVLRSGGESHRQAQPRQPHRQKTYAELVAANYKVLKPKQSRRLLRFAQAFHACLAKQVDLGEPRALPTRIVMALPADAARQRLIRLGLQCGTKLGDPPPGASLQIRKHAVVLYLPKYCILDRKTVVPTTP
jgi:hypothetical protein